MKGKFLFIGLLAFLAIYPAANAQSQETRFCSFNGGRRVQARIVDMGESFRIEWSDGPKMTYMRLNVGRPDRPNIVDKLGGYWWFTSHRDGVGFNLHSNSNANEINCEG